MARRDTRELILATSLALFNRYGEPNVTTNLIADEAEISPGNLHYHFRRKHDIVLTLFKRFATQLAPLIDVSAGSREDVGSLWFRLHLIFETKGRYRFLYRNLSDIAGRMPDIERALRGLLLRERAALQGLLDALARGGVMEVSANQQGMLVDQFLLTLTYWIPFADVFDPEGAEDGSAQVKAIARIFLLALPYLNEPWRGETRALARDYLADL